MTTFFVLILLCLNTLFIQVEALSFRQMLADYQAPTEKKIVVVITSYNNSDWLERNLNRIFSQEYSNYRVIYLDDHSSDGTADLVRAYVSRANQEHRFTLVDNCKWESQMANHYKAVMMCDDDEIVVQMDGDDWLADDMVLSLLNKVYSKFDVWLTYGQFISWPQGEIGCSREIPANIRNANAIREFGFCYSHPRTFYAWLFKKIKLKDLLYKGSFIPAAPTPDVLMMFPMVEMAGIHAQFIPDVLYCWNRKNSLSQHNLPVKKEMPPAEKWEKYTPLLSRDNFITQVRGLKKCGLVLWSCDEAQISHFMESQLPNIQGICAVAVFADSLRTSYKHSELRYIDGIRSGTIHDFMTQEQLDYVLVVSNLSTNYNAVNIAQCVNRMEITGSPLFFLNIGKKDFIPCQEEIPYAPFKGAIMEYRLTPLVDGMCAWQCDCAPELWQFDGLYTSVIMGKDSIANLDSVLKGCNFHLYKKHIQNIMKQPREIALLFEECKTHKGCA